jgi:hypothetical protein
LVVFYRIQIGFHSYDLKEWWEPGDADRVRRFWDWHEANGLLLHCLSDYFAMSALRKVLCKHGTGRPLWRMDDHEVIEAVAWLLTDQRLYLVEHKPFDYSDGAFLLPEPEVDLLPAVGKKADEKEKEPTGWIGFKVVEDESGTPISGLRLRATFSDGVTQSAISRMDELRLTEVMDGDCELDCELAEASLGDTLAFVQVGEQASGEEDPVPIKGETKTQYPARGKFIAQVEAHKAKSGETIAKLARKVDMDALALAWFNWGTRDEQELEKHLEVFAGCSKQDQDGKLIFDDSNEPGIVYLPTAWRHEGLQTDKVHTLRVRRLRPLVSMYCQIDTDAPETQDDKIILETADGGWSHVIEIKNLEEIEPDWVKLIFPLPPPGLKCNLIQDPGKEGQASYIFQNEAQSVLFEALPRYLDEHDEEEES